MGLQSDYGITIKHDGSDISHHVLSYNWTKKVCTGVGTLTLELDNSIFTSIGISDVITIYESSTLAFTGYVQRTSNDYGSGSVLIECQDKSKFLMDYFISQSYLVDYASYTRTWIEQFLTEAQVSYTFLTDEIGQLMSNNTSLGMMSAYDQIMTLLQQTGWYIEFNASGTALIGKLTTQVSGSVSINKSRIIGIDLIRDDKMLRNRAVVWGNANPLNGEQVFADVYRPTAWDIDSYDKRSFVIANSNIPNAYTAQVLANIGLDEFAKITEEKHIVVESLLDVSFATRVYVTSDVFNGSGMVTTYGTSMNSGGLTTNIILDERCPRLFGSFYDFGDYVYVGTDGAGVKRKTIEGSTWYDFSNGIDDLHISDLYKKKDLLVCVTVSGEAYRAYGGSASWTQLDIPPLESDLGVISSGLFPRACILDKTSNNIRLLVDNTEHGNDLYEYDIHADYITAATSGAGSRAWVLDYTANGSFLNSYQVVTEAVNPYKCAGADIENDGLNDYISVVATRLSVQGDDPRDFGHSIGGNDSLSTTHLTANEVKYKTTGLGTSSFSIYNNGSLDEREVVVVASSYVVVDAKTGSYLHVIGQNSPGLTVEMIKKVSLVEYEIYGRVVRDGKWQRSVDIWNTEDDTITRIDFDYPTPVLNSSYTSFFNSTVVDGVLYGLYETRNDRRLIISVYSFTDGTMTLVEVVVDMEGEDFINNDGDPDYKRIVWKDIDIETIGNTYVVLGGFIYFWWLEYNYSGTCYWGRSLWGISKSGVGKLDEWITGPRGLFPSEGGVNTNTLSMTREHSYCGIRFSWNDVDAGPYTSDYYSTGYGYTLGAGLGYYVGNLQYTTYPIYGDGDICIAKQVHPTAGVPFYMQGLSLGVLDSISTGIVFEGVTYVPTYPFPTPDSEDGEIYWLATSGGYSYLVKIPLGTDEITAVYGKTGMSTSAYPSMNCGNIFIASSYVAFFRDPGVPPYDIAIPIILKRIGAEYETIRQGTAGSPSRLDLSDSNPLIVHGSRNLYSLRLYDTGWEEWIDMNAGSINYKDGCFDAKYCYRQDDLESESHFTILYTTGPIGVYSPTFEGVKKIDLDAFYNQEEGNTENFSQLLGDGTEFITMSGARWVETTNYKYPYQYIFVANSGLPCRFYQQNDDSLLINDYSFGLPASSPITIVKIDDEM